MTRLPSALAQGLFLLRGGHRLDGRKDEFSARAFHLLLTLTLLWLGVQLFVIVPLFAARRALGASIYLAQSGAALLAIAWLRRGRDRAAAAVFLSLIWFVAMGVSTFNGGVRAGGVYLALALSINAAWLLGPVPAFGCAAVTLLVSFLEAFLESTGRFQPGLPSSPMTVWNGQILIVLLTIHPIMGVLHALRRQVDALRRSEDRFRAIVDAINDGVLISDVDSLEVIDVNTPACALLGRAAEEIRGTPLDRLCGGASHDALTGLMARVDAARAGDPQLFDYELHRSDGERRWIEIAARRTRVADHDRLVLVVRDIEARRRAEQEQATLAGRLQQAQKLESIGRLAGGVAHDFNNMLTVILGYASLGKAQLPVGSSLRKNFDEIEKAGTRSKQVTQQLLGFSRRQMICPVPSNLNDLVADLMEPLGRLIAEDIEFGFHPGGDLWTVAVDSSQVNQILLNLVVNARDATPARGRLTIETANAIISEEYCRTHPDALPGAFVVLSVSDNGVGMSPEVLANIFEPFFTTKGHEGTGLGLSTVYGIARQNGGFVNVYSEPGHGSTFRVYIPRMAGMPEAKDAGTAAAPALGSGTVLLVEDDDLVRKMVTSSLETIGYTPLVAASPAEAIELCSSEAGSRIRLVLTDVVMPGMNGLELRDRIHAVNPELRVLFMSGYTLNVIVKHGILKPGVNFIQKPFTIDELGKRIEQALA